MSSPGPVPGEPAALAQDGAPWIICGRCHQLRGPSGLGWFQLCSCATAEERKANEPVEPRDLATVMVLCRCCALSTVPTRSRWAHFVCGPCRGRIVELNRTAGRLVIPIGYHSIVNGVSLSGARVAPEALSAFSDQLLALFREQGGLWAWADRVVVSNLAHLGLPTASDVGLSEYLAAVGRSSLCSELAFADLRREALGGDPPGESPEEKAEAEKVEEAADEAAHAEGLRASASQGEPPATTGTDDSDVG